VAQFATVRSCHDTIGTSGTVRDRQIVPWHNRDQWQFREHPSDMALLRWGPMAEFATVRFCYKRFAEKTIGGVSNIKELLFNRFVHISIDELFTTSWLIFVASIWNISVQDLIINTPALRNSLMFQAKQISLAVYQDLYLSKDSSVP